MFDEDVLDLLRARHPRFNEAAYLFVLSALQHTLEGIGAPRHVTGRELAEGARDLAMQRFGPMARTVLEHWGLRSTQDLGAVVFALVDAGILVRQEDDDIGDFHEIYDFEEAFERDYPWGGTA